MRVTPETPPRTFNLRMLLTSTAVALTFLAGSEDALAARHEPRLRTPRAELNAALTCPAGLAKTKREPVLLVHGTGGAGHEAWAGAVNLQAALRNAGLASCYVTLPDYALADLQVSVEYVVAAIRTVYKRTGRRIAIYGLSQGALLPRWALTYWPSLRTKVADAVIVSGPQRGTTWGASRPTIDAFCATGCPPAFIQQTQGSHLLAAINHQPDQTPGGLRWTTVRSLTDELVQPQDGPAPTAALDGASNIAIQRICPGREVRHSATVYDSVAYAALLHAVRSHRSTTPARLPDGVCEHRFAPGLDDATVDQLVAARTSNTRARALAYQPKVTAEPPVRSYALRQRRAKPPGPALTTSARALAGALSCPRGVRRNRRSVLLAPGGGGDPRFVFLAGFERLLRANRFAVCAVSLPDAAFGDVQVQAEYVVAAIRRMAARSGRRVSVVGVSLGGMLPRWALKWWPDVRSLVGDVIGLAPANHASRVLAGLCNVPCPPATRQGLPGSRFLAALNRGDETPGRLAYSVISSATDVNFPPPLPNLKGEGDDSNTRVQAICPGRNVDHGHITFDAVAIALVLDALRHAGPARASRIPSATCAKLYARYIDADEVASQVAAGGAYFGANYGRAGLTASEPALKRYATRRAPRPSATLRIRPRRLHPGTRTTISFRALGRSGHQRWPLPRARIKVGGRTVITGADGRAALRLRVRRPGPLRVRLVAPGLAPVTARLRALK